MQIAILGRIAIAVLIAAAAFGVVGCIMSVREKKKGVRTMPVRDDTENVVALNDRFNRARRMSEDGN